MATQTFYSAYVGNLRSYIVINEKSQDVAGNRTLISYSVYADKRGSHNPFNNFNQTPVQVTIGGTRVYSANVNYDLRGRTTQLIASGETYVAHNSDGSKAVPISLMVDFSSTGTHWGYGKTSTTGSMNLTTIPRASTFSLSSYSFNFATNIAMTINRNDSSFTHNVKYTQPNGTETTLSTIATTSATLNIPISLATQIPNTTSYVSKITVQTKNSSGTVIGSNTANVTVVLNETYKPSISVLNPTGANATIGNNTTSSYNYLGGVDNVGTTITASGSNGSTISLTEYRLLNSGNAQVSNTTVNGTGGTTFTAPKVASGNALFTLQARVRDSRGRFSNWESASIKIRSHYYKMPSIWNAIVGRSISNQNYMVGRVSWSIVPIYNAGGTSGQVNTASMKFMYRKKGTTSWTNLATSIEPSATNYNLPFNNTVFAPSDTFEFIGEITDKFGNKAQTSIVTVNGVFVHMDFGPRGVGIGKDHSDSNYDLEIGAGGVNSEGDIIAPNFKGRFEIKDTRDMNQDPMTNSKTFGMEFKKADTIGLSGVGTYVSLLDIPKWHDTSGGKHMQMAITDTNEIYLRGGDDNGWGSWVKSMNENAVKTILAGSSENYNGSSWIHMLREQLDTSNKIDANMISSNSIVWCWGPDIANCPPTNGLLMSFSVNDTQRTQIYFGQDNKTYQRQRDFSSGIWGAWDTYSTPYSGANSATDGYYIIGDYQVAYGKTAIGAISGLSQTRGGSRNFYRAFSEVPYVQVTMDAQGEYLSGMAYVHSVTKTGFTAAIYDSNGFGTEAAQNRLINYFAIGRK